MTKYEDDDDDDDDVAVLCMTNGVWGANDWTFTSQLLSKSSNKTSVDTEGILVAVAIMLNFLTSTLFSQPLLLKLPVIRMLVYSFMSTTVLVVPR